MSNIFFSKEACVDRLYQQYLKHPKLIVACDFDDTIFDFHGIGSSYEETIELLKKCKELGFYIVIFTASHESRFDFIRQYCKNNHIEIDAINENVIESPFGKSSKIFYNILLDDRAGLREAHEILHQLVQRIHFKLGGVLGAIDNA